MINFSVGVFALLVGIYFYRIGRNERDLSQREGTDLYWAVMAVGGGYVLPTMGLLLIIVGLLSMR